MTPSICTLMAEYNRWMNERLYTAAGKLSNAELKQDRGAFFSSLFNTLNHIAVGDLIWLHRFADQPAMDWLKGSMASLPNPTALREPLAPTLPELAGLRGRIDAVISELASRMTDPLLAGSIRYANTAGQPQAKNLGLVLLHFFNHQTHHRGQASTLLFQAGVDIGVTDLNALVPNEA